MLSFLIKRLLGTIPVVLMVMIAVFAFVHLLPGDPARLVAGPEATAQDVAAVRTALGLDRPLPQQFLTYVGNTLQGDFGTSLRTRRPVVDEIGMRLMPTVWLTLFAMVWAVALGLLIGVVSAVRRGRWQDYGGMILAVSGISFPPFWLGLLLMYVFALNLGWLPSFGYGDGAPRYLILPAVALGVAPMALLARTTRAGVLEVMASDHIRTALAKGASPVQLIRWHVVRNAMVLVVTTMGLQIGSLLGQALVIEKLFSWPGIGSPIC